MGLSCESRAKRVEIVSCGGRDDAPSGTEKTQKRGETTKEDAVVTLISKEGDNWEQEGRGETDSRARSLVMDGIVPLFSCCTSFHMLQAMQRDAMQCTAAAKRHVRTRISQAVFCHSRP